MSTQSQNSPPDYRVALQRARDTIVQLLEQNASLRHREEIAIVGMACRFPGGADDPDSYWRLLDEGRDGISEIGDERWPTARYLSAERSDPGRMYTAKAGLLKGPVDRFDARFFGVSAGEARSLDPQQRLLMELSWQAFEDAGIRPSELEGSKAGVFVGLSGDDYARMHRHSGDERNVDAYSLTGTTMSTASGRLAYYYGLHGPCFTLDTACSSSLVALHLAARSIRAGECDLALVGASNLILMPENHIAFCKMGALSPDGKCRTFDALANGYVRSEGVAFVVLQTLSAARDGKRRVHGIVSGSAMNQDGKTAGLSAPNPNAQRDVIAAALADAQLGIADVDYVEAHGTGTVLGDPIELEALASIPGRASGSELLVGSAKSNIGHMEPAAGLGGLIKILLAMREERLPANLHFTRPNPNVDLDALGLRVVDRTTPWLRRSGSTRRAGLSAFGFSGTNAHLVISEPPIELDSVEPGQDFVEPGRDADDSVHVLRISARTQNSLRALAARYVAFLQNTRETLPDICAAAITYRTRFNLQVSVAGRTAAETARRLQEFVDSTAQAPAVHAVPSAHADAAPADVAPVAWLFTGQGAQHPGMGRDLYASDGVFRAAIDRCAAIFDPLSELSLTELMFSDDPERIHRTQYTQPALFALEFALSERWLAWGFRPTAVAGHSIGEYVAACVAGILSLEDALTLVVLRGRLMGELPSGGAMAAVLMDEREFCELAVELGVSGSFDIAAVNGPRETVVSGPVSAIDDLVAVLESRGISSRKLTVSHAFHSRLMAPIAADFAAAAARVAMQPARIPIILNTTGEAAPEGVIPQDYWAGQLVSTVYFQRSLESLVAMNVHCCLELGPHPVLAGLVESSGLKSLRCAYSLRRGRAAIDSLCRAQEEMLAQGVEPDWGIRYPDARQVPLPLYAFDGERYWHDDGYRSALSASLAPTPGPQPATSVLEMAWTRVETRAVGALAPSRCLLLGDDHPSLTAALGNQPESLIPAPGWSSVPDATLLHETDVVVCVEHLLLDADELPRRLAYLATLVGAASRCEDAGAVWVVGSALSDRGPVALDAYRGALLSLLLDHPGVRGGVIELGAGGAVHLRSLFNQRSDSTWFRSTAEGVFAARLVESAPLSAHPKAPACALITGGLGGIGLALAEQLVERGTRQLLLLGRRLPSDAAGDRLRRLRERGAGIEVLTQDIASGDAVGLLRAQFAQWPNSTVFHAAGVMPANPSQDYQEALSAKLGGALNLLAASRGFDAIELVMLGSISALTGTPGAAAYSAANGALSSIVRWHRQQGGSGSCVNWGPWQDGGIMTAEKRAETERSGFSLLSSRAAMDALGCLAEGAEYPCIASADWRRVVEAFALRRPPGLLADLCPESRDDTVRDALSPLFADLGALSPQERREVLLEHLTRCLVDALGLALDDRPALDRGFFELGMDSLKALEFREATAGSLGVKLDAADIFDYPTLETLAAHILSTLDLSGNKGAREPGRRQDNDTLLDMTDRSVEDLTEDELAQMIDREYGSVVGEGPA